MGREDFAAGTGGDHRQPYLGRGLFAGGIVLLLLAVVFAASASIVGIVGLGTTGARELAGALAGIGLAAALVGALAVVPTDRGAWYRGLAGGLLALGGVGAFLFAYPGRWYGDGADLAFSVLAVYSLGIVTTASYLFSAVADLARRVGRAEALAAAVPGVDAADANESEIGTEGTSDVEMERTTDTGTTAGTIIDRNGDEVLYERTGDPEPAGTTADTAETGASSPSERPTIDRIEPADGDFSWPDSGFAIEPIDRIESTDRSPLDARNSSVSGAAEPDRSRDRDRTPIAVAHNGAGTVTTPTADSRSTGDESLGSATEPTDTGETGTLSPTEHTEPSADGGVDAIQFGPSVDRYCGNCAHFRYVQTDRGLSPYCGYHDEVMDDMESCFEWTSNA